MASPTGKAVQPARALTAWGDQAEGLRRAMAARPAALALRQRTATQVRPLRVAVLARDEALATQLAQQLKQAWASNARAVQVIGRSAETSREHAGSDAAAQCTSQATAHTAAQAATQTAAHVAAQTADHVLLALDGSDAALPASMTWAYALLRQWQAAEGRADGINAKTTAEADAELTTETNAGSSGKANSNANSIVRTTGSTTTHITSKTRLLLFQVQSPSLAAQALHNLQATARRYLGLELTVAACWPASLALAAPAAATATSTVALPAGQATALARLAADLLRWPLPVPATEEPHT